MYCSRGGQQCAYAPLTLYVPAALANSPPACVYACVLRVCASRPVLQIRGVAKTSRGLISLVLQLEELGCMTLMPASHLLPSQRVQLVREARLEVPTFVLEGRALLSTGAMGERAVQALQVRGGGGYYPVTTPSLGMTQ